MKVASVYFGILLVASFPSFSLSAFLREHNNELVVETANEDEGSSRNLQDKCTSIGDYICSEPSLTEFCKNTKTLGFLDDLQNSSDIWTVFAPANEAFDESASRAINSFLTTTSTDARKVLAFHHVNGESLSYDDLVCKETIEMYLPNSFSRTKCEKMQGKDGSKNEEMKYQVGSGNSIVGIMPMITSSAQCDNGFIHIVDGILLPKPANLAAAYETGDEVISGGGDLIKDLIFGPSSQTAFQFNNLMTEVEVERLELDNPNVVFGDLVAQEDAAAKAAKCLNLMNMEVDYSSIAEEYSCLPAYCESITTVEDCQSAFYKGCSFCAGQCVAAAGMQAAVIKCIREAWKDAAPNSVNGAVPDGDVIPSEEEIIFHNMAGLSELKNVIGGARSVMSWGIYQDKRPKNYRVPIHVHPLGGYTCVNDGPVEMIVQGAPNAAFEKGQCFNMQAFTKMTQNIYGTPNGYTVTDYFNENSCLPTWVVLEEQAYFVQDQQFSVQSDLVCP